LFLDFHLPTPIFVEFLVITWFILSTTAVAKRRRGEKAKSKKKKKKKSRENEKHCN